MRYNLRPEEQPVNSSHQSINAGVQVAWQWMLPLSVPDVAADSTTGSLNQGRRRYLPTYSALWDTLDFQYVEELTACMSA